MKRSVLPLVLVLCAGCAAAQSPTFIHPIRTAQYEQFWLHESPLGGYIAYGSVSDSVDLDPSSSDVWIEPQLGYEEAFLAGYDANGAYLWHKQFWSTKAILITHISFTEDGQFYLSGEVTGYGDVDPSASTSNVSCGCTSGPPGFETDYRTGWYGKYTATGDYLWHEQFGSTVLERSTVQMHYSPFSHDLFLFGTALGGDPVDFDPGPGSATITPTPIPGGSGFMNENIYARYDSSGTLIWHRNFGAEIVDVQRWDDGVQEHFYLTGWTMSNNQAATLEDHDPGAGVLQAYNANDMLNDVFAARFNDNGDLDWCRFFFGMEGVGLFNQNEGGTSVAVDDNGDAYIGGVFQSDYANTSGGSLLSMEPFGGYASDALLVKLAGTDGSVIWEKHMGSAAEDTYGSVVALDDAGRVYIASAFEGTAELNSAGPSVQVSTNGVVNNKDAFVACFDGNGAYQFSGTIGGPEFDGITQLLPGNNSLCIVGNFRSTADLDLGPGVDNRTSLAYHDPFFACFDLSGIAMGVPEEGAASAFTVFPNPASDGITISNVSPGSVIEFFDALGQRVLATRASTIDVNAWAPGLYFVKAAGIKQRIVIHH